MGAAIEIQDDLGSEVRILRDLDTGRVLGIHCGPAATVADILAQGHVVALMRRYEGLVGKIRQLVDDFRALAGRVDGNPFPVHSDAYESFAETQKLPTLIALRRDQLGGVVGREAAASLRREIDVLQNEYRLHREVVQRLRHERGIGYVGRVCAHAVMATQERELANLNPNAPFFHQRIATNLEVDSQKVFDVIEESLKASAQRLALIWMFVEDDAKDASKSFGWETAGHGPILNGSHHGPVG